MIVVRKSKLEELEKQRKRNNFEFLLKGILLGATIGGLLAILFAPCEGKAVRTKITTGANSLCGKCKSLVGKNCCCSDECCEEDFEDETFEL